MHTVVVVWCYCYWCSPFSTFLRALSLPSQPLHHNAKEPLEILHGRTSRVISKITSSTSNGAIAPVNPQIREAWFIRRALLMVRVWSRILMFLVTISELSADTDIYVSSTRGSDSHGDGSFQRPFASLQRGQWAVRDIVTRAQEDNIVVNVGAGTYFMSEPLTFTAEDSPARHGRTTYRGPPPDSNPGEQAIIYGGISVPFTMWRKHTAHIWKANLSTVLPVAPSPTSAPPPQRYPSVPLPPVLRLPFQVLVEGTEAAVLARTPERGSGYLRDLGCSVDDGTLLDLPQGCATTSVNNAEKHRRYVRVL